MPRTATVPMRQFRRRPDVERTGRRAVEDGVDAANRRQLNRDNSIVQV
jgi:hypothetical protein